MTASHDRMWLAHHDSDHAQRCTHVAGYAVCRRCAVLYPLAIVVALAVMVTDPSAGWPIAAMWVLPIPMVLEWTGEQLGRLRYSPTRQVVVTAVGAPALGAALAVHALEPFSVAAVAPVLTWTVVCLGVAIWSWWRSIPDLDAAWEQRHQLDETARQEHLIGLLRAADARRDPVGGDPVGGDPVGGDPVTAGPPRCGQADTGTGSNPEDRAIAPQR